MSGRLYDDNYLKGPADWIISVTVKEWKITPKKPSFKYRNMTFLLLQDSVDIFFFPCSWTANSVLRSLFDFL